MSASKPMSLLCLECVLENMEANLRFRLAQRCPTIRSIEKRVPLYINYLKLSEYQFTVNDTSYRLGIHQDYPDELQIPDAVKIWNDRGGEQEDLDKYGIKIYPDPQELTPGDLKIDNGHPRGKPMYKPRIWRMESRLRAYTHALEHRNGPTPTRRPSPAYSYTPSPSSDRYISPRSPTYSYGSSSSSSRQNSPRSPRSPAWSPIPSRSSSPVRDYSSPEYSPCEAETDVELCSRVTLQEKIKSKNAELLPFLMRRDGEEPSWRLLAQLTISKDESSKVIYRGKYTTLAQNMKSIYTFFFGNRKHPISIGKLFVECYYDDIVLRFPENLKFKISSMEFEYKSRSICEALAPIVCESSFPLKHVKINHVGGHPWIRTARSLKLTVDDPTVLTTQYILSLGCKKIEVKDPYSYSQLTIADCIPVVEKWLASGKAAGTCYEFPMQLVNLDILEGIASRFNGEFKHGKARIPTSLFGLELHLGYNIGDKTTFKMEFRKHQC